MSGDVVGYVVPLSVLSASFFGGAHCIAMCGGVVVAVVKRPVHGVLYHLGRLVAYMFLGGVAGFVGSSTIGEYSSLPLAFLSSFFIGSIFVYWGYRAYIGKGLGVRLPKFFGALRLKFLNQFSDQDANWIPFVVGLFTIALPCGWLYGFVVGAATTQSAYKGALLMVIFWLGTVPALSIAPVVVQKMVNLCSIKSPVLVSGVLVFAGFFTMFAPLVRWALAS